MIGSRHAFWRRFGLNVAYAEPIFALIRFTRKKAQDHTILFFVGRRIHRPAFGLSADSPIWFLCFHGFRPARRADEADPDQGADTRTRQV